MSPKINLHTGKDESETSSRLLKFRLNTTSHGNIANRIEIRKVERELRRDASIYGKPLKELLRRSFGCCLRCPNLYVSEVSFLTVLLYTLTKNNFSRK